MIVHDAPLPGVKLIQTTKFCDSRGHFLEVWNERRYAEARLRASFVQVNVSKSRRGVIRGLHYQAPHGQAKLVSVLEGEIWDVAVDVRVGSPTFGAWYGTTLSSENGCQLYIPTGFAHGFAATSEHALVTYKCTEFYEPASERTVLWNDAEVGIEWPFQNPIVSEKDLRALPLGEMEPDALPRYDAIT